MNVEKNIELRSIFGKKIRLSSFNWGRDKLLVTPVLRFINYLEYSEVLEHIITKIHITNLHHSLLVSL